MLIGFAANHPFALTCILQNHQCATLQPLRVYATLYIAETYYAGGVSLFPDVTSPTCGFSTAVVCIQGCGLV
jgi:hypothetical protein